MKEQVKKFVTAIVNTKYKLANDQLKLVIDKKIKQQIINNNRNLF